MSSISSFVRRTLFLLSFIFVFQFLLLPSAEAVSPWEGTPWEGTPWEGQPWEGNPWEGKMGEDGPGPGDTPVGDHDSFDDEGSVGSGAEAGANETEMDNLCLPIPSNDWGDTTPRNSSTVTDDERKEMLINATKKLAKNNPAFNYAIAKDLEAYIEKAEEEIDRLLDRPHGTINDLDIPSDQLASLAQMGYSDDKVEDLKTPEGQSHEGYLKDNGWEEMESRNHWTGFEGRVFINKEDGTIAFSFGGTEYNRDYGADLWLASGRDIWQYDQAAKFVEEMMERYPGYQPVLVGHSLGGAIAQYISMNTQIPATTFNAPGIGTREFSLADSFFKDGGWKADWLPFALKAFINEGSLNPFTDQVNRNRLLDDLIVNHVMEGDEIGTYQIHLGQTNIYSEDGDVELHNDYSDEAHDSDLPLSKSQKTLADILDKLPSHGLINFTDIMEDCY